MKKIMKFLFSIIILTIFATSVNASSYPYNLTVNRSGSKYEYVNGLEIYYNTANGYNVYVYNNSNNYFDTSKTFIDPLEANKDITYIINNSNVTSSSYKNYYIAQAAILWAQDELYGNNNNISKDIKDYIKSHTSDTVCYYINKLVNDYKLYSNEETIKFNTTNITFNRKGNYYYSNVISVLTNNLKSTPTIRLYNAPTSSDIVNNTVVANGSGSFQIRIPVSSLNNITEKDFEVYLTSTSNKPVYLSYSSTEGAIIYSRNYFSSSKTVEASLPVNIKGVDKTRVRINILDDNENYIRNLSFYIYNGDCTNKTCYSDDLVHTFTTSSNYTELNNILSSGTYTLVNKSSNNNYNIPTKTKINISNTTELQNITISENNNYNNNETITKRLVKIYNDTNKEIKIYSNSGTLIRTFSKNNDVNSIELEQGTYYISYNTNDKLYFRVLNDGTLQVKYNNSYVNSKYVTLDTNNYNDSLINNDYNDDKKDEIIYDEENNTYYIDGLGDMEITATATANATATASIDMISNIINCPITSLSSTIKYVIGAIIIAFGSYMLIKNVKRQKNNN